MLIRKIFIFFPDTELTLNFLDVCLPIFCPQAPRAFPTKSSRGLASPLCRDVHVSASGFEVSQAAPGRREAAELLLFRS